MSRSTTHRSSDVAYNGKALYVVSSRIAATAATVEFGHFMAPCDGTIVYAAVNTVTAPTHATSDLYLGIVSDTDSLLAVTDWQNHATGVADVTPDLLLSGAVSQGSAYHWTFAGGDTTGELFVTLVIEPR